MHIMHHERVSIQLHSLVVEVVNNAMPVDSYNNYPIVKNMKPNQTT